MIASLARASSRERVADALRVLGPGAPPSASPVDVVAGALDGVTEDATASEAEKALAAFARETQRRSMATGSAHRAQTLALQAIAGGVAGPVGPTLAAFAMQVLDGTDDARDARTLGHVALGVIGDRSTSVPEKVLSACAREACAQPLKHESAIAGQMIALNLIAQGLSAPPEVVLAQFGKDAAQHAATPVNARSIGYSVLDAIARNSRNAALGAVAQAAYDASGQELTHETGVRAQARAYDMILAGTTATATRALATYGLEVGHLSQVDLESVRLGRSVLESIATSSIYPQEQLMAATAHNVSTSRSDDFDAVNVDDAAFRFLESLPVGGSDAVLAEYGLQAMGATRDPRNGASIGSVVLEDVARSSKDDRVRRLADRALSRARGGLSVIDRVLFRDPDATAARRVRDGFEAVLKRVEAAQEEQNQVRDEKSREELQKMADALAPKPSKQAAEVKVEGKSVIIGGIKIQRRESHAPPPTDQK